MTIIPTFCRHCASTVDIEVEGMDPDLITLHEAFARLGVTSCERCRPTRRSRQPELFAMGRRDET